MQEPFNIVFIISALIIIGFFIFHFPGRYNSKNENKVADMPFYIPGVLEKPSTEKQLRKVSDITTEVLRDERNFNNTMKRLMWSKEYIEYFRLKLERINIRLSIKQTKP